MVGQVPYNMYGLPSSQEQFWNWRGLAGWSELNPMLTPSDDTKSVLREFAAEIVRSGEPKRAR
jgi:hypothetical protein